MTTLRELVARYDLKFNDRAFKKADTAMDKLVTAAKGLGIALSAAVLGRGFMHLINLASDAEETLNVLNESFGGNVEAVKQWAGTLSKEVGRSEYELREMAGSIGAVLNPMMDRNADKAAEMSTRLAALAVDLGSFFNRTDAEAMQALLSGITGQSEPLRRFGVVLLDATLKQYAAEKGIRKKWQTLSVAEKTEIRYQYILEQTTNAQGDAMRTSEGFANASKAVKSALRDLGTAIGLKILPAFNWLTLKMRTVVRWFSEVAKETNIVEAALVTLGTVGIAGLLLWLAKMGKYAKTMLLLSKWALIIAAVVIAVDELITTFKKGDTVLKDFIDSIWGVGATDAAVDYLTMAWERLVKEIKNAAKEATKSTSSMLKDIDNFRNKVNRDWEEVDQDFSIWTKNIKQYFTDLWDDILEAYSYMWTEIKLMIPKSIREFFGDLGKELESRRPAAGDELHRKRAREREERKKSDRGSQSMLSGWFESEAKKQEEYQKRRLASLDKQYKYEAEVRELAKERGIGLAKARRMMGAGIRPTFSYEELMAQRKKNKKEPMLMSYDPSIYEKQSRERPQRNVQANVKPEVQTKVVHIRTPQTAAASAPVVNQSNNFNMSVSTQGKTNINELTRAGRKMSKDAASYQKRATVEAMKQRVGT